MLMNPPWDHIEFKEKEWFAVRNPDVATAKTGAERKKKIELLQESDRNLYKEFIQAKRSFESASHFAANSHRYPLCGRGRINSYAVFAEFVRQVLSPAGRVGIIVPSGIATDDTTKFYFQDVMETGTLASLYDFENRQAIFPGVHRSYKFCLLTLCGAAEDTGKPAEFVFFALDVDDLRDVERPFTLTATEIALLNPNTRTCPIFRSRRDAELTKAIYRRVPVLITEGPPEENPWGVRFRQGLFNMTSDSHLFHTREQLEQTGWQLEGNRFVRDDEVMLPLYEAKMLHQFDHRWATYDGLETRDLTIPEKNSPTCLALPRYWVAQQQVENQTHFFGFRRVARTTDERTFISSIIPRSGIGDSTFLIIPRSGDLIATSLMPCLDCFAFDFVTRQKIGGMNASFFLVQQLPIIPPSTYKQTSPWHATHDTSHISLTNWLLPRVLELTYTAWDLQPFARDCGYDGPPFRWDEARRFLLRCELDATYFHLYGIERDDVDYIMETFPIVKRKDIAKHGEFRTKRVILEMYDAMADAMQGGAPYETRLDPPPADPRVAHDG